MSDTKNYKVSINDESLVFYSEKTNTPISLEFPRHETRGKYSLFVIEQELFDTPKEVINRLKQLIK